MTAWTATKTGNWSDSTVWGGSPIDGDTFTIPSPFTVTFDVNQGASGLNYVTGVGITIAAGATLQCSTTAGTYYLKHKNLQMAGAGNFNAGSAGTPLPANVIFTIDFNGYAGGVPVPICNFYCTQPTIISVVTNPTVSDAAAQAVLSVATSVTGDPLWGNGAVIGIANPITSTPGTAAEYTISSVSATTITLTSNLTAAVGKNARVALLSRNIKLVNSATTAYAYQFNSASVINAECIIVAGYASAAGLICTNFDGTIHTTGSLMRGVSGTGAFGLTCGPHSVISGGNYGFLNQIAFTMHGLLMCQQIAGFYSCTMFFDGIIACATSGMSSCVGGIFASAGLIENCSGNGIANCSDMETSGGIQGCGYSLLANAGLIMRGLQVGTVIQSVNCDLRNDGSKDTLIGYGCNFASTTQISTTYSNPSSIAAQAVPGRVVSFDHAGVQGALRAWMSAGFIVNTATVFPPGYNKSYNGQFNANSTSPLYHDIPFWLEAGATRNINIWMRKDTNGMVETPNVQIIDPTQQAFSVAAIMQQTTMPDNSNVWNLLQLSINTSYSRPLILRIRGRNGSGNWYFNWQFQPIKSQVFRGRKGDGR